MKLIQLDISAIRSSDSQNNAYVLLLNEITGERQLPIVIGWCEARSIAIALEKKRIREWAEWQVWIEENGEDED